jgi:hypothetical protein
MPVQNIHMENLVLDTDIGVEIKDAKGFGIQFLEKRRCGDDAI